jgi:hypothetical protein
MGFAASKLDAVLTVVVARWLVSHVGTLLGACMA